MGSDQERHNGSMPPKPRAKSGKTAGRLDDQLCFALYAATNAITRMYRPLLKEIGLTYPQYLALLVLWESGAVRTGEIAERLQLPTHALSPIVDRLEEAGLVERVVDPDDGRAVMIDLTAEGRRLEKSAADVQEAVRCSTNLDAGEVNELRAELHRLVDLMADDQ